LNVYVLITNIDSTSLKTVSKTLTWVYFIKNSHEFHTSIFRGLKLNDGNSLRVRTTI